MEEQQGQGEGSLVRTIKAGESLVNTSLADIVKSVKVRRSCTLQISNYQTKLELSTPHQYLHAGVCVMPPAPVVRPGYAEVCLFQKKFSSLYGSAGLLSYNITLVMQDKSGAEVSKKYNDGTKLYLMWSVPSGFGTSYHAVGIRKGEEATSSIYQDMFKGCGSWYQREDARKGLHFEGKVYEKPIKLVASISSVGNAAWKVDIC